jgi:hypothetical protein
MAGNFRLLVSSILRVANQNANPQQYLQTLASGSFTNISTRGGAQIISVSVNGKTTSLQVPAGGWTEADLLSATEYALQVLESGMTRPTSRAKAVFQ